MKKLAIIGSIIFLIGGIVFVSAFAVSGWDITKLSTVPTYEEKQYSTKNTNQDISIKDHNKSVSVGLSSDDQIHLTYYENTKEHYEINDQASLTIESKRDYRWYDFIFSMNFQSPTITILLPANYAGNLNIKTSNAQITIDSVTLKQLHATTSNGYMRLKNVTGAEHVTLRTTNNGIEMQDVDLSGTLKSETSNGSINLKGVSAQNLESTTTNSNINAINTKVAQSTLLKSSNGSIHIQDFNAGTDTALKTSNNRISGNILNKANEFSITSRTSNAKNNLPENFKAGNKKLDISTSNGEIFVKFAE